VEVATAPAAELYCPTCERNYPSGERCPDDNTRLVRIAGTSDALIGRQLDDRYTVKARIGAGGMGTVYRATQHAVGRDVAIKVVSPRLVSDPGVIKRFLREAKVTSRLSHPNIVSVIDFGQTTDGLFYLVTELLTGRTLDVAISDDGKLSPERLVRLGAQICDALEAAHAAQVVHRDLKPQNVMMLDASRDLLKVLDFGLVKSLTPALGLTNMTQEGALLGTPAYMPPEVIAGQEVDERADLYSLGCVLYSAAAGKAPYQAGTAAEIIAMHAMEAAPKLTGLPASLATVIERLMAKEPKDRYPTAHAARHALDTALAPSSEELVRTLIAEPEVPKSTLIGGWSGVSFGGGTVGGAPTIGPLAAEIRSSPSAGVVRVPAALADTMVVRRQIRPLPLVLGGVVILAIGIAVGVIALRATAPSRPSPGEPSSVPPEAVPNDPPRQPVASPALVAPAAPTRPGPTAPTLPGPAPTPPAPAPAPSPTPPPPPPPVAPPSAPRATTQPVAQPPLPASRPAQNPLSPPAKPAATKPATTAPTTEDPGIE
jgi:serine/threonine protein kinase